MNGTLGFSLGVAAWLMEEMRYKTVDSDPVKQAIKESKDHAEKILMTREPFMHAKPEHEKNPE